MKPEQNYDFAWTVQNINGEYWYFGDTGFPRGPFVTYDEATEELDEYSYCWYEED